MFNKETESIRLTKDIRERNTKDALDEVDILTTYYSGGQLDDDYLHQEQRQRLHNISRYIQSSDWKHAKAETLDLGKSILDLIPDDELHSIAETAKDRPSQAIHDLVIYHDVDDTSYIGVIIRQHHVCNYFEAVRRLKIAIQNLTDTPKFYKSNAQLNRLADNLIPEYRKLKSSPHDYFLIDGENYKSVPQKVATAIVKDVIKTKHGDLVKLAPLIKWERRRQSVLKSPDKPKVADYPGLS